MIIKDIIPEGIFNKSINLQGVPKNTIKILSPKDLSSTLLKYRRDKLRRLAAYQQGLALNQAANVVSNQDWQVASKLNQVPVLDKFAPNPHPERSSGTEIRPLGRDKRL